MSTIHPGTQYQSTPVRMTATPLYTLQQSPLHTHQSSHVHMTAIQPCTHDSNPPLYTQHQSTPVHMSHPTCTHDSHPTCTHDINPPLYI